ncbi:hypothetical protein C0992_009896 [Termitomyces sp. T32_za158]|nr:hypothetical protein C0992_009896 [Termitomyces sp. T32_za158]
MAEKREEVFEVEESDEEEELDPHGDCSIAELIALTEKLEQQSLRHADANFPLELPQQLRNWAATQDTIDIWKAQYSYRLYALRHNNLLENRQINDLTA